METKKTRLQAFQEAQQTGQIAIQQTTAAVLAEVMKMEKTLDGITELFQSQYLSDEYREEISNRFNNKWQPLYDEILAEWCELVKCNMGFNDFKGL